MKRTISIYLLDDPRVGRKKGYIGWAYTNNLQKRYKRHFGDRRNAYRWNWIRKLRRLGLLPIFQVLGEYPKFMWSIMERYWIAWYRFIGYELTNLSGGGKGLLNPTPEILEKISMTHKGKKLTEQDRRNLDRTGIPSPMRGKKSPKTTGELNGRAKLTENQVISIRQEYAKGDTTCKKLAIKYGLHSTTIWAIIKRRLWGHIQ